MFIAQVGSLIKKDQRSPAAKKPLYNPWFAARVFVGSKRSFGNVLNIFLPLVVQANISNQRKYKCNAATSPMSMFIAIFMV